MNAPDDLDALLDLHFDGQAGDADRSRLAERLRSDAQARRRLVARTRFEAILRRGCQATAVHSARRQRWRVPAWVAWSAAAVLALALGAWAAIELASGANARASAPEAIALLSGSITTVDGRPLTSVDPGSPIVVSGSANAEVALSDGSSAQLSPTTQAVFRRRSSKGRGTIDLLHGHGRFHIAKGKDPMHIVTPVGRVVVLGTRFSIDCPRRPGYRTMEVAVQEGKVRVEVGGEPVLLSAGEQRNFVDPEATRPAKPREGVLIAAASGRVVLRPGRGDSGQMESHPLRTDAKVTIDNAPGRADSIPPGTHIRFTTDPENRITDLVTVGLVISCRIEAVDAAKRTVDLSSNGSTQPLRLPLAETAAITVDGVPAGVGSLRSGMNARVSLAIDGGSVVTVAAMAVPARPPGAATTGVGR